MKTKGKKPIYIFLIVTLVLLSHVSGFKIGAVKSFNWDIALMLTPYGILKNYLFSETYLTPYFSNNQQPQPLDDLTLLYFVLVVNACVGLWTLRALLRSKI